MDLRELPMNAKSLDFAVKFSTFFIGSQIRTSMTEYYRYYLDALFSSATIIQAKI